MHQQYQLPAICWLDLGIMSKSGSDKPFFARYQFDNMENPYRVEVIVYNYQQQNIYSGITIIMVFPLYLLAKTFPFNARSEKQKDTRPDDGSSLSLGAFDVAGKTVPKG
jgi:hypothetical protein